MKKPLTLALASLLSFSTYADEVAFKLDKVDFVVSARLSLKTKTALLTVSNNTTLQNVDMVQARNTILANLNQIAKGDWQLTQFNRSQDSSGLEKLDVEATLRVPETDLTQVYAKAKQVSKPGMAFNIKGIDFKPSYEELEAARSELRANLYRQISTELTTLNKAYPDEHYASHKIFFYEGDMPLNVQGAAAKSGNMVALAYKPEPLAIYNELKMHAYVELASNREGK